MSGDSVSPSTINMGRMAEVVPLQAFVIRDLRNYKIRRVLSRVITVWPRTDRTEFPSVYVGIVSHSLALCPSQSCKPRQSQAMSTIETPSLPQEFLDQALQLEDVSHRVRWYMCAVVNLSSMGYPDVIPQVYEHLDVNLLSTLPSNQARKQVLNQVREALIKSTGIVGAGRTGNAMRTLSGCIPEEFREADAPRAMEDDRTARERGKKFWTNIYARNPAFDPGASVRASPDYAFVVRGVCLIQYYQDSWLTNFSTIDVLYARVFSYDGILDDLTTGFVMVSGLYGLDCQNQLQHHMKGMLWNGATRQDLLDLQKLCLGIAEILNVKFRHPPAPIPVLPE